MNMLIWKYNILHEWDNQHITLVFKETSILSNVKGTELFIVLSRVTSSVWLIVRILKESCDVWDYRHQKDRKKSGVCGQGQVQRFKDETLDWTYCSERIKR